MHQRCHTPAYAKAMSTSNTEAAVGVDERDAPDKGHSKNLQSLQTSRPTVEPSSHSKTKSGSSVQSNAQCTSMWMRVLNPWLTSSSRIASACPSTRQAICSTSSSVKSKPQILKVTSTPTSSSRLLPARGNPVSAISVTETTSMSATAMGFQEAVRARDSASTSFSSSVVARWCVAPVSVTRTSANRPGRGVEGGGVVAGAGGGGVSSSSSDQMMGSNGGGVTGSPPVPVASGTSGSNTPRSHCAAAPTLSHPVSNETFAAPGHMSEAKKRATQRQ
mmetsp:Transcript_26172/g.62203  ORF Transcript_26172/g.62203 Transcript_26172/m.62203 type:complete len:276 (-) Transcript_26172:1301-2128(-)